MIIVHPRLADSQDKLHLTRGAAHIAMQFSPCLDGNHVLPQRCSIFRKMGKRRCASRLTTVRELEATAAQLQEENKRLNEGCVAACSSFYISQSLHTPLTSPDQTLSDPVHASITIVSGNQVACKLYSAVIIQSISPRCPFRFCMLTQLPAPAACRW